MVVAIVKYLTKTWQKSLPRPFVLIDHRAPALKALRLWARPWHLLTIFESHGAGEIISEPRLPFEMRAHRLSTVLKSGPQITGREFRSFPGNAVMAISRVGLKGHNVLPRLCNNTM